MAQTIIGSSFTIEGDIIGEDDLIIQGKVKGKIAVQENLVIEQSAIVEADLCAKTIDISGQVSGDVEARERVVLQSSARLYGDLRTPRLNMADGSILSGSIDMQTPEDTVG